MDKTIYTYQKEAMTFSARFLSIEPVMSSCVRQLGLLALCLIVSLAGFGQSCPTLPGGIGTLATIPSGGHHYWYPAALPSNAESGALGVHTAGFIYLSKSVSTPTSITIKPTFNGSDYGKVLLRFGTLPAYKMNAGATLQVFQGADGTGALLLAIDQTTIASESGKSYVFEGVVTLVFAGTFTNGDYRDIYYCTGDRQFASCSQERPGLFWRDFISPDSYVAVDEHQSGGIPTCVAYFNTDQEFVYSTRSFCIDEHKGNPYAPSARYPGKMTFSVHNGSTYDIDRNGVVDSDDALKIARIIWMIENTSQTDVNPERSALTAGIWETQKRAVDYVFTPGSLEERAQQAVLSLPIPPEPTFSVDLAAGETGTAIAGAGTIKVDIPFSWSAAGTGQTNSLKLELPAGVSVTNVVGGTLAGNVLTFLASKATLTLSSSNTGEFLIRALYDDPAYYNLSNLQFYDPCDNSVQSLFQVGKYNMARPYRAIALEWTAPLPVKLVRFETLKEEGSVHLNWEIAEAVDFSHFELEKSYDGRAWNNLTTVRYRNEGHYKFTDNDIRGNLIYYRLKMTDLDGSFDYSAIKSVNFGKADIRIAVFPNPAADFIKVSGLGESGEVVILNMHGRAIKAATLQVGQTDVSLKDVPTGVYLVQIRKGSGENHVQKIVKQ